MQEKTCKKIGYEYYCKELFVVRHKSKYSCKSAIYFDLDKEIKIVNSNSTTIKQMSHLQFLMEGTK